MMETNISGTGVALITPFDRRGEIDFTALGRLLDYIVSGGVDYIVALGTTAESATMTPQERSRVLQYVVDRIDGRLPVVAGLGGNNTAEVVASIDNFHVAGVDALLSVTPYYNRPSQQGLYEHFKVIAAHSTLPIMLYNVPSRTGVNMTAQTTLRLAHDCDNIMGIKEASGNLSQMAYILRDRPEGFKVFSGDDSLAFHAVAMGGHGVISVAANAFPEACSTMIRDAASGNTAAAAGTHIKLLELCEALFVEGNPVGVKVALEIKGLAERTVRLPLVPASDALAERLTRLIGLYKI